MKNVSKLDNDFFKKAVFAVVDGYCSINLTKNIIPGVVHQIVDGIVYDVNAQLGLPKNAAFTDVVEAWAKSIPEQGRAAFLEVMNRERLLERFKNGETQVCFTYWTRTVSYEPMLADSYLSMFLDADNGDIIAVSCLFNHKKLAHLDEKYKQDLWQNALLEAKLMDAQANKELLERKIISLQNIHAALTSGGWNLIYNEAGELCEVNWSDTLRHMLGFESTEDFPNTFAIWSDKLHPEDKERTLQAYRDVLADKTCKTIFDVEYRILSKNKEYHWYRATGYLSRRKDSTPQSFDGVFINMDEKHATSEKLQKTLKEVQAARDELLLDHEIISAVSRLYFSIYRIDLTQDFYEEISSDRSVHRLTGHEGRAQKKMYELCDTIVAEKYRDVVRHFFDLSTVEERMRHTDNIELDYCAADGNWHQARFIEKKRDKNGRLTHILYVTRIVSQEKKKELEQQRLEIAYKVAESANEAKTTFLLNMSHDIRTPMNAILGYSNLMKNSLTDPTLIHYQEMIEQSGEILLSIINNVLDMARIESGKMELDENYDEAGSIVERLCQVYQEEAAKKSIQIAAKITSKKIHILCDITKVEEILTNLISNAIKYTLPGGKIMVSVEDVPWPKEGYIGIKTIVADTGIGMSKEYLPHIFDAFMRENNSTVSKVLGTGLGMSIVKKLVDLMGGTIEVESELGKGSKFTVLLPHKITEPHAYSKQEAASSDELTKLFTGKHILLAEDNELNAEIAIAILEDMGFVIDRAADGIICVDKLEQAAPDAYDAVLMDIQMPNMDGYKATQIIRQLPDKRKANIPIIAMTANAFEEDRKKALEMGMNAHIAKPIVVAKVAQTLLELLK